VRDLDGREPDFEPLLGYTPLPTEREYRAMVHRASLAVLEEAPIEVDDGGLLVGRGRQRAGA
jgi:hypothetical protein